MGGDNLDVLMPRAALPVFVLDTGVRKPDVTGLPDPAGRRSPSSLDYARGEPLIVALELVVENDAAERGRPALAGASSAR